MAGNITILTCVNNLVQKLIGVDGKIPWHCKEDLEWFKKTTYGKTVVMGRKTYDSIGKKWGLPGRDNIVLSRSYPPYNSEYLSSDDYFVQASDIELVRKEIIEISNQSEVFIIGGADIYHIFAPICDSLIVSTLTIDNYTGTGSVTVFPAEGTLDLFAEVNGNMFIFETVEMGSTPGYGRIFYKSNSITG